MLLSKASTREAVLIQERVDHPAHGPPGGDHLPSLHAAGTIQHDRDVPREHMCPGRARRIAGGTSVKANVPGRSASRGEHKSVACKASPATGKRRMKSRFSRSPGCRRTVHGGP